MKEAGQRYPYLLIDMTVGTDMDECVKTGLFSDESGYIYSDPNAV